LRSSNEVILKRSDPSFTLFEGLTFGATKSIIRKRNGRNIVR
jgi:hypothetical protein